LLLDEFQDTTPLQYEIIFLLTEKEDQCGKVPFDVAVHPGKLFVVGDLKQSIYRFNGANLNVCQLMIERLERAGAKVLQLAANFRSVPEILHPLNIIFKHVFQPGDTKQAPFAPLEVAHDQVNNGSALSIWTLQGMEGKENVGQLRDVESKLIADWIDRERTRIPFRDITILLRVMTDVPTYLQALRERGIPFVVEGGKSFVGKPEVREFVALLRILANPCDTVALLSVLRSPFGSVSDVELAYFASCNGAWNPMQEVDPKKFPNIARFFSTIAGMIRMSLTMRTDEIIQMLLKTMHAVELNGLAYEGSQRVANVSKIADRASAIALRENYNIRETVAFIEQEFDDADHKEGESPLADEKLDAVRILTIHKAKGLEFPIVIIPDLIRDVSSDQNSRRLDLDWKHIHKGTYGLNLNLKDQLYSLTHILLECEEKAEALREHMRLFYVACTRAKNRLILIVSADKKQTPWIQALSAWGYPDENSLSRSQVKNCPVYLPKPVLNITDNGEEWGELINSVKKFQDCRALASIQKGCAWLQSPSHLAKTEAAFKQDNQENAFPEISSGNLSVPSQENMSELYQKSGTIIHWLLQRWDLKDVSWLQETLELILKERSWEYSVDEISFLSNQSHDILESFLQSELPALLKRLDIVGREMPFLYSHKGVLIHGRIDLVYRSQGNYIAADFKTDRIVPDEEDLLMDKYRIQLASYANALQKSLLLKELPRREIWMLRTGKIIGI
ncbi:MAG: 3'-5' exonuclease, partial [Chlamydiota bacterium]|nr:3'-5' exonuclease [Chlamydiota bacterium]